jgi:Mg-chelatase subunit ChlD
MNIGKVDQPKLAQHDATLLDLAFCMDCTGSMGSYIENARNSIRTIVEEIVASEKSDVRLALVEYRDHPPQESTFVTKTHDFTSSIKDMKNWLDACSANGGGDTPEAVADGLQETLKLSWREKSTKICVLISDGTNS